MQGRTRPQPKRTTWHGAWVPDNPPTAVLLRIVDKAQSHPSPRLSKLVVTETAPCTTARSLATTHSSAIQLHVAVSPHKRPASLSASCVIACSLRSAPPTSNSCATVATTQPQAHILKAFIELPIRTKVAPAYDRIEYAHGARKPCMLSPRRFLATDAPQATVHLRC